MLVVAVSVVTMSVVAIPVAIMSVAVAMQVVTLMQLEEELIAVVTNQSHTQLEDIQAATTVEMILT